MNTTLNVKTILTAAALAVLATTLVPADGFAAVGGRGPNGGGSPSAGASTGSGGSPSNGNPGHGDGNAPAFVIGNATDGGDPQVTAVALVPVVGPPRRVRHYPIRIRIVRRQHCAGRVLVDGDTDDVAFRACQQAAY